MQFVTVMEPVCRSALCGMALSKLLHRNSSMARIRQHSWGFFWNNSCTTQPRGSSMVDNICFDICKHFVRKSHHYWARSTQGFWRSTNIAEPGKTDTTARWASSGFYFDALIMSAGVPQLSGQQFLAPNEPFWEKIDSEKEFSPFWNRGQSYANLQLAPYYKFTIWNPSPDVIQIVGDPCDARFSRVELG